MKSKQLSESQAYASKWIFFLWVCFNGCKHAIIAEPQVRKRLDVKCESHCGVTNWRNANKNSYIFANDSIQLKVSELKAHQKIR